MSVAGIEDLQVLQSKGSKPLRSDQFFDAGSYDVMIGAKVPFFIFNPNTDWTADISDFNTANTNSFFSGPELILPGQTVECSVTTKPVTELLDNFDFLKPGSDIPPVHDKVEGRIVWKRHEITSETLEAIRKNQTHLKRLEKDR